MRFLTQPTPNPNSLKITTDAGPFIEEGMESFSDPEQAARHRLGRRLFSLTGVSNIFILPEFLTITKHPATDWDSLLPKIHRTLEDYFSERQKSSQT